MEDSPEECSAKDGSSLVVGERVTQLWYVAKTQPPVGKGMKVVQIMSFMSNATVDIILQCRAP